jgi:Asp/Glu/hydantoin racemase
VLHTVPALAPVFQELLTSQRADLDIVHVADPSLLSDTVAAGEVPARVQDAIAGHLRSLRQAGARAVLVTCSSIGEAAESASAETGVPLVRVDAAMAAEAVARARAAATDARPGRIAVLATLSATLGPTSRIVERARAGEATVGVTAAVVEGAADARAAGDQARHDALIAEAVRAADADVIVLAQASMAAAAGGDARVLTSPESGAAAFAASLGTDAGDDA